MSLLANKQNVVCPVCGSENVDTTEQQRTHSLPYAEPFSVAAILNTCRSCGESGDFLKVNDQAYEVAESEAITASIHRILDDLNDHGVTMAYIERVFSLPKRTIARWKNGSDSATGVALLRLVRTCPWLLEVAKDNYSHITTARVVVTQAANLIAQTISSNATSGYFGALMHGTDGHLNIINLNVHISEARHRTEPNWAFKNVPKLAFAGG